LNIIKCFCSLFENLKDELDDEDTGLENDDIDQSKIELSPGIHHVRTAETRFIIFIRGMVVIIPKISF
jgi:hypothetical protein